jgi:hypothetical protein
VTSTFSDQVKDLIGGTLVHRVIRMRLFTGEHHAREELLGIFLTVTVECMIPTRLDLPDC